METMNAAKWLRETRAKRNLSLRDLARATGISHTTISFAERGDTTSYETWKTLAAYFETPIELVLSWAGYLNPMPAKTQLEKEIEQEILAIKDPGLQRLAINLVKSVKNARIK